MPDPKKKPIIVNSKNDPRYRAYQDSLTIYNSYIRNPTDKWLNSVKKDSKGRVSEKDWEEFSTRGIDSKKQLKQDWNAFNRLTKLNKKEPGKKLPFKQALGNDSFNTYVSVFKKPQQPVIVQSNIHTDKQGNTFTTGDNKLTGRPQLVKRISKIEPNEKQIPLQQLQTQGVIQNNQRITAPIPNIKPQAIIPKSWNIDYSAQRMNNSKGYYNQNNVQGVDIETVIRAKEQADRVNAGYEKKYGNSTNPKAIERLNTLKDTVTITPQYAYGGQLNNNMQNNNLTRFNEGGTHKQNPLGGVPVGNGNTVEEGETKMKNYVYSNRLSIDENMTKEMNLPSYIKGKSFASASKAIDNKFKDRNDNHSLETKKVFLERLKEAQETLKQQEQQRVEQIAQSMQSNQQEIPDLMNGQIPEGMEEFTEQPKQFFEGGDIASSEIGNQTGGMSGLSGKMSPYLGSAVSALSLAGLSQGVGASTNKTNSALSGALTGAQAGMTFGPLGAGIGAAVGIGAGLLGANKANKAHLKDLNNQALAQNRQFQDNNFAYGGNLNEEDPLVYPNFTKANPYSSDAIQQTITGPLEKPKYTTSEYIQPTTTPGGRPFLTSVNQIKPQPTTYSNLPTAKIPTKEDLLKNTYNSDKPGSWAGRAQRNTRDYLDKNGGKFLKYAPVAMNAYQLAKLTKPENQRLQRLSDKYKAQYVDEAQLQNIANQEMTNTINSISQSGASQGVIRSSILDAGLNKTKALSDAYMKANAENRATDDKAQQFNLGVNQFNTQTQHQESENWERNAAAYRNEKSKLLSAIGTDLGSIGKEEVNKNQIAEALGYSWDGKYMVNKKTGEKKTYEEVVGQTKQNSYGGYLKMNKIGRK